MPAGKVCGAAQDCCLRKSYWHLSRTLEPPQTGMIH
jgi:hypothetical protein